MAMNFLDIVKSAGTALLATNPAAAAALTLINTFLPDDKKLGDKATGEQAIQAYQGLPPEIQERLAIAKIQESMEEGRQVTARHNSDMTSDSWLSKNTRPLIVLFLTISTVLLAYLSIFILSPEKLKAAEPWIDLLQTLLITAFTFYFSSRGIEKVQKIRASK
jgi:hypothetical protein